MSDDSPSVLARGLAARLELERSLGVEFLSLGVVASSPVETPAPAETAPAASVESVAQAPDLEAFAAEARACRRCGLSATRHLVVFGEGAADAELMLVGETPGEEEDRTGRPFAGPAGKLLSDMIEKGLKRPRASVYLANLLKCRPPEDRDPEQEEAACCLPWLVGQVERIRPRVILCLGRNAAVRLTGKDTSLAGLRGAWHEWQGTPMRVTYHPADLVRERQRCGGHSAADREAWEDLKQVAARLGWTL